ncbi:AsnC family protein [Streptomyces sp. NRRL F-5755]|uniref:AsnC family transcriptional regulator n=1 Tax=Streptomyces sp. NRRL F-5755 TaxID=1519475 RepID=UPI00099BF12C
MDSGSPDDIEQHLLHTLQLDGRAPFSQLARTLGVSEHTAARRYRRLRGLGPADRRSTQPRTAGAHPLAAAPALRPRRGRLPG